jgi:hypothetical protein
MDSIVHQLDLSKLQRRKPSKELVKPNFLFPGWKCMEINPSRQFSPNQITENVAVSPRTEITLFRRERWACVKIRWDNYPVCDGHVPGFYADCDIVWPNNWQATRLISTERETPWHDLVKETELKILRTLSSITDGNYGLFCNTLLPGEIIARPIDSQVNFVSKVFRQPENENRY